MYLSTETEFDEQVQEALKTVGKLGWSSFATPPQASLADFMMLVACSLGEPRGMRRASNIIDQVVVNDSFAALPRSLSRIHGKGKFPLHTDTAHWTKPCRYIVLGCQNPGRAKRRTKLLKWSDIALPDSSKKQLNHAVFRIRSGASSFYATITSPCNGFVRFDLGCMTPVTSFSEEVRDSLLLQLESSSCHSISWKENDILVIDNWAVLHGREDAAENDDDDRTLLRILVQ